MYTVVKSFSLKVVLILALLVSQIISLPQSAEAATIEYEFFGGFGPRFTMVGEDDASFFMKLDVATGLIGVLDTTAGTFSVSGDLEGNLLPGSMDVSGPIMASVEMFYSDLSLENINGTEYWVGRSDSSSIGSVSGTMLGEDYSFALTGKFADITDVTPDPMATRFGEFINTGPFSIVFGALEFAGSNDVFFESWIQNADDSVQIAGMPFSIRGDFHTRVSAENPEPASVILLTLALGTFFFRRKKQLEATD